MFQPRLLFKHPALLSRSGPASCRVAIWCVSLSRSPTRHMQMERSPGGSLRSAVPKVASANWKRTPSTRTWCKDKFLRDGKKTSSKPQWFTKISHLSWVLKRQSLVSHWIFKKPMNRQKEVILSMLVELLSIHGEASSLGNVQVEDNVTPKSARLRKTVDFLTFSNSSGNKQFPCDAWELSKGFCCSVEKSAWCIFLWEDLKILSDTNTRWRGWKN